jgi:uncharacterized MAPEG superfamily protein
MMTFAYWTILVAALLPYLTVAAAKGGRADYDNTNPRLWADRQTGWRRRAEWAHRNHFEAFPPFAAAVIVAGLAQASPAATGFLSGTFIALRIGYTLAYLGDLPTLRTVLWALGLGCVVALFCIGA